MNRTIGDRIPGWISDQLNRLHVAFRSVPIGALILCLALVVQTGCEPGSQEPAVSGDATARQTTESTPNPEVAPSPSKDGTEPAEEETDANRPHEETAAAERDPTDAGSHSKPEDVATGATDAPAVAPPAGASWTLRILSWNVESEGSAPTVIARQLRELERYDIYALTEVLPEAAAKFTAAPEGNYQAIVTRSGYNDRMQIIYDADRFELVRRLELDEINNDRHRSPLVAHLRDRTSGREFLVMVNHLARGDAEYRTTQARQLVEWARNQNLPVVAVGDYNFDFDFASGNGNEGFRAMLRDNIFQWVRPVELIDSNWFDPEPDGQDNFPGSLLDFAFVAGSATTWQAECRIIVRPGDFPDDETTSDHRPFELILRVVEE